MDTSDSSSHSRSVGLIAKMKFSRHLGSETAAVAAGSDRATELGTLANRLLSGLVDQGTKTWIKYFRDRFFSTLNPMFRD